MPFGRQTTVVKRNCNEENTFAVVHWVGIARAGLLPAITRAVTRWVGETEAGKGLWEESSKDLNLGDLSDYVNDEALAAMLCNEGVHDLEVITYSDADPEEEWQYDTVLVDESALKREDEQ